MPPLSDPVPKRLPFPSLTLTVVPSPMSLYPPPGPCGQGKVCPSMTAVRRSTRVAADEPPRSQASSAIPLTVNIPASARADAGTGAGTDASPRSPPSHSKAPDPVTAATAVATMPVCSPRLMDLHQPTRLLRLLVRSSCPRQREDVPGATSGVTDTDHPIGAGAVTGARVAVDIETAVPQSPQKRA